jgi:tagatose 6-phosphate kinase
VILAAGLTPAWQQIMCFRRLDLGEVNRAAEVHWCASGKAINAGMALAALGASAHTLSPAGGWSGQAIRAEFAERQLPATWTPTGAATRVCTTVLGEADGASTELVENAAALTETELADFLEKYHDLITKAQFAVLTGSLPKGTPTTFYRTLLERTPCPVLLDARGPELLAALGCKPRVVKPNREELALTVGRPLPGRADVLSAMRELIDRGARSVIVTHGKDALWVMEGTQTWELTPPTVTPIVNPIGCGDCLAAGVAWGLAHGDSLRDAVRLGIAAAADNLTHLLPARLSLARVEAVSLELIEA